MKFHAHHWRIILIFVISAKDEWSTHASDVSDGIAPVRHVGVDGANATFDKSGFGLWNIGIVGLTKIENEAGYQNSLDAGERLRPVRVATLAI